MSVLREYLTKNKVMTAVLVTAIAPLSFVSSADASPIRAQNPVIEMVTSISAASGQSADLAFATGYDETQTNDEEAAVGPTRTELDNFFEMKSSYEELLASATALNMENKRIENQIEKIIWLYDELHSISAGINGRISVHEELKLLAGVAEDWLREQKINNLIGENPEDENVRYASYKSKSVSPKESLEGAQALKDYLHERDDLYKRTYDLLDVSNQYMRTNVELTKSMETMLKQLDVLYASSKLDESELDAAAPVKAIEAFQVAIDEYVELRNAAFIVDEEKAVVRDEVGELIQELDEIDGPALSSMKP